MIHTYGDSHAWFGWRDVKITRVSINRLGPRLMYSFGSSGEIIVNSKNITNGDSVIFCFGEIDCRCHIHKFVNPNKSNVKEIIENVASLYIQTVIKNFEYVSQFRCCNFCLFCTSSN